ncbi:MAG: hypothetical protein ACRYGR_03630 [Janthinobacterium lividum]
MSTGDLALLFADQPHKFTGLRTIGKVVFIFDIVIFSCICTAISARFFMNRGVRHSLPPTRLSQLTTASRAFGNP